MNPSGLYPVTKANSFLLISLPAQRFCLVDPGAESVARCVIALQAYHALRNTHSLEISSAVINSEFTHIALIACDVLAYFLMQLAWHSLIECCCILSFGKIDIHSYIYIYIYIYTKYQRVCIHTYIYVYLCFHVDIHEYSCNGRAVPITPTICISMYTNVSIYLTMCNFCFDQCCSPSSVYAIGVLAVCLVGGWMRGQGCRHFTLTHFCMQAADLVRVTLASLSQNRGLRTFRL